GLSPRLLGKRAEAAEFLKGTARALRVEFARRDDAAAEACEHLLVEQHRRRPCDPLIDHETDRVGADIDDGYGTPVLQPALRALDSHAVSRRQRLSFAA